mgnify:CR=1 FL=1
MTQIGPLVRLVEQLQRLPGIGPKGAQRLAFHLLRQPRDDVNALIEAAVDAHGSVDVMINNAGLGGSARLVDMTDEELERARELMSKQRDLLRFYWTDNTAVEQALASGELVASYAWNSALIELKKQNVPVAYMKPKEGIYTWVCGFSLIEGGDGDDAMSGNDGDDHMDGQDGVDTMLGQAGAQRGGVAPESLEEIGAVLPAFPHLVEEQRAEQDEPERVPDGIERAYPHAPIVLPAAPGSRLTFRGGRARARAPEIGRAHV